MRHLVAMRKRAGLTQRELAARMGREQSFIWRLESGERRLDLVEFLWLCNAMGEDATSEYQSIMQEVKASVTNPRHQPPESP